MTEKKSNKTMNRSPEYEGGKLDITSPERPMFDIIIVIQYVTMAT
jgi:hypothetical protein